MVSNPDDIPLFIPKKYNRLLEGANIKEAMTIIRQSLVPEGYTPQTWRLNLPETVTEMLRLVVATFRFTQRVEKLKTEGNLHIPVVDPITCDVFYHREVHNHVLKRITVHTHNGGFDKIDVGRFHEAMKSKDTSLDYHGLV